MGHEIMGQISNVTFYFKSSVKDYSAPNWFAKLGNISLESAERVEDSHSFYNFFTIKNRKNMF